MPDLWYNHSWCNNTAMYIMIVTMNFEIIRTADVVLDTMLQVLRWRLRQTVMYV